MTHIPWQITLRITRQKTGGEPFEQAFPLAVDPDEYVLDAIERVWAFHDRGLTFRHACHHSTCGACGMLVNGVEKLTCITPIREVTQEGSVLRIQPLRNFPVVSDLVVDMGVLYQRLEEAHFAQVSSVDEANRACEPDPADGGDYERLADCIECGCCISACPIALTSPAYVGPAVLAGIQDSLSHQSSPALFAMADQENGAWRCHSAFECTAVCPSNVDPGWRIMDLRKRTLAHRFRGLFSRRGANV